METIRDTLNDVAGRAEAYRRGPASLVAMIIGFIVFWPVGLALLLWRLTGGPREGRRPGLPGRTPLRRSSGNSAFEDYKADTLARIEEQRARLAEEQREFERFAEDLQRARDRAEFEQFRAGRRPSEAAGHPRTLDPT